MRILKPLAITVSAFTMAVGGIVFGAGSASATYSDCLDTAVANGGRPTAEIVTLSCEHGARKNFQACKQGLMTSPTYKEYGPELKDDKADLACKRAAVLPAP
ncbi:hypothetical protein ACFYWO_01115 [Streptomyces sp. NPDC002932]|uniref:hypothetical protein n=1 Tax=Streptomyces sp. NPDC002932 TaxID=3364672 RepID=UPI0036C12782